MAYKSNLKTILDGDDPKKAAAAIDRLVTHTKIARHLIFGYYTGRFCPSVRDALKIAGELRMPVEAIWRD